MGVSDGNIAKKDKNGWEGALPLSINETSTSTINTSLFKASLSYNDNWRSLYHVIDLHPGISDIDEDISGEVQRRLSYVNAALSGNVVGIINDSAWIRNVILLKDILINQTEDDRDFVSDKVVDNVLRMVFHLKRQPDIYRTFENSLNLQYELFDRSYMEFEVFEDRVTCMIVPQRVYEKAVFPEVKLSELDVMNQIVGDFYGDK